MAHLLLVRHGKSEWNELGLWTGLSDIDLVERGVGEAREAGRIIAQIGVHSAHVSELKRAKRTLEEILSVISGEGIPVASHVALNERNYGIFTGKNKWQIKEEVGELEFQAIRRSWDKLIPEGETLKDVHDRVVPYYAEYIMKDLLNNLNTLVVAHGNTLRALVKHIEGLDETQVAELEIGTGEVYRYEIDSLGTVMNKEILVTNQAKNSV